MNVQLLSCVTQCLLQATSLLTLWQVGLEDGFLTTHGSDFSTLLASTLTFHCNKMQSHTRVDKKFIPQGTKCCKSHYFIFSDLVDTTSCNRKVKSETLWTKWLIRGTNKLTLTCIKHINLQIFIAHVSTLLGKSRNHLNERNKTVTTINVCTLEQYFCYMLTFWA